MVVSLLVTPVLVAGLGSSLFGVWEVLNRLALYVGVPSRCPAYVLQLQIAKDQMLSDPAVKRQHVANAFGVWLLSLPVAVVAGMLVAWLSPGITKVLPANYPIVRITFALLVFSVLLDALAALPGRSLSGMNLGYKCSRLDASLSIVAGLLTAGAIYLKGGLLGIAGAQIVIGGLTAVALWFLAIRSVPWFHFSRPNLNVGRPFLRLSLWNCASGLLAQLQTASDGIILAVVASTSMVTQYVLTSYVARTVSIVFLSSLFAVTPGLGGLVGQRAYGRAAMLRNEIMSLHWCLATAIGSTILLCNRSFVSHWVGKAYYAGFWPNLLIVVCLLQSVLIIVDAYIIDTTLELRRRVTVNVASALLSLPLAFFLTRWYGMVGLSLGLLGGRLVQTVSHPLIVKACFDKPERVSPKSLVRPAVVTALLFAVSAYLGQRLVTQNWIELIACVVATFVLVLGVAPLTGLSSDLRQALIRRFQMMRFRVFE
jgi:O-antigen/teichoic acid export membrane protein